MEVDPQTTASGGWGGGAQCQLTRPRQLGDTSNRGQSLLLSPIFGEIKGRVAFMNHESEDKANETKAGKDKETVK